MTECHQGSKVREVEKDQQRVISKRSREESRYSADEGQQCQVLQVAQGR
jgi:hypothetical protein